jgi:hypothetical protein
VNPPGVPNPLPAASAADQPNGSDKPAAAHVMRIHLPISKTSYPDSAPNHEDSETRRNPEWRSICPRPTARFLRSVAGWSHPAKTKSCRFNAAPSVAGSQSDFRSGSKNSPPPESCVPEGRTAHARADRASMAGAATDAEITVAAEPLSAAARTASLDGRFILGLNACAVAVMISRRAGGKGSRHPLRSPSEDKSAQGNCGGQSQSAGPIGTGPTLDCAKSGTARHLFGNRWRLLSGDHAVRSGSTPLSSPRQQVS